MVKNKILISFLLIGLCTLFLGADERKVLDKNYIDAGQTLKRDLNEEDRQELIKDTSALDKKDVYFIQYHLFNKKLLDTKRTKLIQYE